MILHYYCHCSIQHTNTKHLTLLIYNVSKNDLQIDGQGFAQFPPANQIQVFYIVLQ